MRMSQGKKNLERLQGLLDKWEQREGSRSVLRDITKNTQSKVLTVLSKLSDDEVYIVLNTLGSPVADSNPDDQKETTAVQRFLAKVSLSSLVYEYAQFNAFLAPVWNIMRGDAGNPGYCMNQSMHKVQRRASSHSFTTVSKNPELQAFLIGYMMYNDLFNELLDWDDAQWFGENWQKIAPIWNILKADGTFEKSRVEMLMNNHHSSGNQNLTNGLL